MAKRSVLASLAIIAIVAVGLAALRDANEVWAGIMISFTLIAIGTSIIGAITRQGSSQYWWIGFATFATGYTAATFVPVISIDIGPRLVTTKVLQLAQMQLTATSPLPQVLYQQHASALASRDALRAAGQGPGDPAYDSAKNMIASLQTQLPGADNRVEFVRVGHCLFALLAGLIGGWIALRFRATQTYAQK